MQPVTVLRMMTLLTLIHLSWYEGRTQDIESHPDSEHADFSPLERGDSSPPTSTESGGTGFDDNVDDVPFPVDGGLSLLLMAGAVYGVRRSRKPR